MSGAQATAVLGVISSIITIVETTRTIYGAARDGADLHNSFQTIAESLSMVFRSLRNVHRIQAKAAHEALQTQEFERSRKIADTNESIYPIVLACQKTSQNLRLRFNRFLHAVGASRISRLWKAFHTVAHGRQSKVESMFGDVLRDIHLFTKHTMFDDAVNTAEMNATMQKFIYASAGKRETARTTTPQPTPTPPRTSQDTSQNRRKSISRKYSTGERLPGTTGHNCTYNNSKFTILNRQAVVIHGGQSLSF